MNAVLNIALQSSVTKR